MANNLQEFDTVHCKSFEERRVILLILRSKGIPIGVRTWADLDDDDYETYSYITWNNGIISVMSTYDFNFFRQRMKLLPKTEFINLALGLEQTLKPKEKFTLIHKFI